MLRLLRRYKFVRSKMNIMIVKKLMHDCSNLKNWIQESDELKCGSISNKKSFRSLISIYHILLEVNI